MKNLRKTAEYVTCAGIAAACVAASVAMVACDPGPTPHDEDSTIAMDDVDGGDDVLFAGDTWFDTVVIPTDQTHIDGPLGRLPGEVGPGNTAYGVHDQAELAFVLERAQAEGAGMVALAIPYPANSDKAAVFTDMDMSRADLMRTLRAHDIGMTKDDDVVGTAWSTPFTCSGPGLGEYVDDVPSEHFIARAAPSEGRDAVRVEFVLWGDARAVTVGHATVYHQ